MRLAIILKLRLRSLFRRAQVERELAEELAGSFPDVIAEQCRDARGWSWLENLLADLRRSLRRLASSPGFSLTAVFVLALGVAASTAMFSLCDAVLLRPLPGIVSGSGLVHLERYDKSILLGDFSYPDYLDYREQSHAYTSLAADSGFQYDITLPQDPASVEMFNAELVSPNYFRTLGIAPERGRFFSNTGGPADPVARGVRVPALLQPGPEAALVPAPVIVVSDHFWRTRLAASPAAIGTTLIANRIPLTIIGIAPPGFRGASQTWAADLWMPITLQPQLSPMGDASGNCLNTRHCGWVTIFGHLAPGVSLARAQTEASTIASRIGAAHPDILGRHAEVVPGLGSWSDDRATQSRFLYTLLAATMLVAAMTAASLGSLFLARMGRRQHEVATQLALGASRWRVARQFLFESIAVAVPGAALGLLAAPPLARWLVALQPGAPTNLDVSPDLRVWAFAASLAALSALAMALAPALLAARNGRLGETLQSGGRTSSSARHRTQRALLSLQVSLALVLLVAAVLATRTFQAATHGQIAPDASHIALARVDTGHAFYSRPQAAAFFQQLEPRLAAQPGFLSVALTACLSPAPCNRGPVFLAGAEPPEAVVRAREFLNTYPRPDIDWVSPGYFNVFSIPIVAGRGFTASDRTGSPLVCVINQSLATRLWPHGSPLGQRLAWPQFNFTGPHDFTVIGVTADRRSQSLLAPPPLALFVPVAQVPFDALWVAARTALPAATALAAIRQQVASLEPRIPLTHPRTLAEQVRSSLWQPLAIASLSGLFGLLAAILAAIGLFGTLAQIVQERRRELGIRLALGATPHRLVRSIVASSLRPLALGLASGALVSAWLLRALRPWLFGVTLADPTAWLTAAGLLASASLAGAWLAARRAARLSPITALRCD